MKTFIIFLTFFVIQVFYSQDISQKKIFRSNEYYFYKTYGKDSLRTKETARRGLISKIATEIKGKPLGNTRKVEIENIKYKVIPLIDEYKVIAYVQKNNINTGKENNLQIISVEEKKTDKPTVQEKKEIVKTDTIKHEVETDKKEKNVNKIINYSTLNDKEKIIISDLLKQDNANYFIKTLNKYTEQGDLQYVKSSTYFNSHNNEGFFVALFDKTNLSNIALLDKNGKEVRIDFKNNTEFNMSDTKKYYQLWIKIF